MNWQLWGIPFYWGKERKLEVNGYQTVLEQPIAGPIVKKRDSILWAPSQPLWCQQFIAVEILHLPLNQYAISHPIIVPIYQAPQSPYIILFCVYAL